jgi:hypothetical protein
MPLEACEKGTFLRLAERSRNPTQSRRRDSTWLAARKPWSVSLPMSRRVCAEVYWPISIAMRGSCVDFSASNIGV